jgi:hypothetical protein
MKMRFARPIFAAIVVVALSAYALDCSAMTTPEQAMQCCKTMHCSSHAHHGQDCCKTMPTAHPSFVQPSSLHGLSFSPVVLAVMPASVESRGFDSSGRSIAAHCHAPPIFCSPPSAPIRI